MVTNGLKISDTMKKEFLELLFFRCDQKYDKFSAVQI